MYYFFKYELIYKRDKTIYKIIIKILLTRLWIDVNILNVVYKKSAN